MQKVFSSLDLLAIISAAEAIRRSKRIFICAHDISHVLAEFLAARLKLLYFDPQIIDLSSLNDTQEKLEVMTPEDLVIFIAFPKYYYPLGSIAKNAVSRGAQLLTITDSISSPTVQYSKYLLVCHTSTRVFYNSLTLPMAMANLLLSYLVIDLGPDYRSRDLTNAVQEQILREQDSADSTEKIKRYKPKGPSGKGRPLLCVFVFWIDRYCLDCSGKISSIEGSAILLRRSYSSQDSMPSSIL